MKGFFEAKNIAIVGVSEDASKVGHVIFRNLIDGEFQGKVFIVNKKGGELLGNKVFKSVKEIDSRIDLVVIAVPAEHVISVVKDCAEKKVHNVVIVSAGFREVGNHVLEDKLHDVLNAYKIKCIGVNCLGVMNVHNGLDTVFLPRYRMRRPRKGSISFMSQSGAVGSATLDLIGFEGYGIAKFISYGNATNVDESDLLEFLGDDKDTRVICWYVEGIKNGKKFLDIAKKVSKKKPIIVLKGGRSEQGSKATLSHTGALAGSSKIYDGAFKQAGVIEVSSLREMFNVAKILDKNFKVRGKNVQIITDGGGFGILAVDAASNAELSLPSISKNASLALKKFLPPLVNIANPLDLVGDADTNRYRQAMNVMLNEKDVDILLVILLYQVPRLGTDAVDMIIEAQKRKKKPIIVVSPGGEFTQSLKRSLEADGVPVYDFPEEAIDSIKFLIEYAGIKK